MRGLRLFYQLARRHLGKCNFENPRRIPRKREILEREKAIRRLSYRQVSLGNRDLKKKYENKVLNQQNLEINWYLWRQRSNPRKLPSNKE